MTNLVSSRDAAIDIETTGLSPWEDRIVTIAVVSNYGDEVWTADAADDADEQVILDDLNRYIKESGFDCLVTWNGSEFDLPFIGVRQVLTGSLSAGGPFLSPQERFGKYGKPRYHATWWSTPTEDVAYMVKSYATRSNIKWSLKPFAEATNVGKGLEVDFETTPISSLTSEQRQLYCASDAELALGIWTRRADFQRPSGRAVLLDGNVTFL